MNPVYIRLVAYVLSTVLATLPASWAGWVSYDAAAGVVQISVEGAAAAILGGLAASSAIFARFGVK